MDDTVLQDVTKGLGIFPNCFSEHEKKYFSLIEQRYPTFSTDTWGLPPQEGLVLYAMSAVIRPSLMVEVGTCGGFSTSFFIGGRRHHGHLPDTILLHAFDLNEFCPSLPDKPIGFALDILVPEMRKNVTIHTGSTSADISKYCPPHSVQLAFIDADHNHPAPLLDLIYLIPCLTPDAWIILHDVNMPSILFNRNIIPPLNHGAKWLYQHWKGKKFASGTETKNVGVIQMPSAKNDLFQTLDILAKLPIETASHESSHAPMLEKAKAEIQKLKSEI